MTADIQVQNQGIRRISLSLRPHGFGFVVFEDLMVLDSGVRRCESEESVSCLAPRLRRILTRYDPTLVVVESRYRNANFNSNPLIASLSIFAKELGIRLEYMTLGTLKLYFAQHGAHTRFEIAIAVAKLIPDLAWQLPPKRQPWESDHYAFPIFDAAALVLPLILPMRPELA